MKEVTINSTGLSSEGRPIDANVVTGNTDAIGAKKSTLESKTL
jgi:hypothetical protein